MFMPSGGILGGLGSKLGSIMQNPAQLGESAMFNMGIGLLDPNVPLSQAVLGGISSANSNTEAREDRERVEKLRQELAALLRQQQQQGAAAPGGMTPGPVQQPMTQAYSPQLRQMLGM